MAFFDDYSRKVSHNPGDEEIKRLTAEIEHEETKIGNLYATIGRAYIDNFENDPVAAVKPMVDAVFEARRKINDCYKQIEILKNLPRCPVCGMAVEAGALFCSNCGSPAPKVKGIICSRCGAAFEEGTNFCTACGNSLGEPRACGVCASCGASLEQGTLFCTECGHEVGSDISEKKQAEPDQPSAADTDGEATDSFVKSTDVADVSLPGSDAPAADAASADIPAADDVIEVGTENARAVDPLEEALNEELTAASNPESSSAKEEPAGERAPARIVPVALCTACGAMLEEGALFCTECGTPVAKKEAAEENEDFDPDATIAMPTAFTKLTSNDIICSACGEKLPEGTMFCTACGTPVDPSPAPSDSRLCPVCGTALDGETRFCTNCGAKL